MTEVATAIASAAAPVGVCLIAKDEARYLVEWVAHYRALGFDRILVYDNGSTDATARMLQSFSSRDQSIVGVPWTDIPGKVPQITAYEHAVRSCGCEWLAFFDADELLVLKSNENIREFLGRYPSDAGAVAINWLLFGSSSQKYYVNDLQARRFRMCARDQPGTKNRFVKSIARAHAVDRVSSHTVSLHPGFHYYNDRVESAQLLGDAKTEVVSHEFAQLNHYVVRSLEEFQHKRARGNVARALGAGDKFSRLDEEFWRTHSTNHREDSSIDIWTLKAKEFRAQLRSWLDADGVVVA